MGVRSWTVETPFHRGGVYSVAYHPKGGLLATASHDGTIRLFEPDGKRMIRALVGHDGPVTSLSFSPDGSVLASGSRDRTFRLWDASGERAPRAYTLKSAVRSLAFAPAGHLLALADDARVQLWDAQKGELVEIFSGDEVAVSCVDWAPDRKTLYVGHADGTIRIWDVKLAEQMRRIEAHPEGQRSDSPIPRR